MILDNIIEVIESQKVNLNHITRGMLRMELDKLPDMETHALILTGVRRCGKSTLVSQFLKERHVNFLYLNFEDPRLYEFELKDFTKLDEYIQESKIRVLAFDEIQVIDQWERYIRQKVDQRFRVILTGSNASMLSRELGTKLTGRQISRELFPFSFEEFCQFRKEEKSKISASTYLETGGFPEYVVSGNQEILTQLFNDILVRDIAARHGIRDIRSLQRLALYLITNISKPVSASNLKSLINLGATSTILEHMSYLEDAYLLFFIPKFSYSLRAQAINPRKVYAVDTGLVHVNSLSFNDDHGRKLENMVFLHLRRSYHDISYFSEKGECDFVVSEKGKVSKCIQVCYHLNPDNQDRELNGLFEALEFFSMDTGWIITLDQKDKFERNGKTILAVPVYEWA